MSLTYAELFAGAGGLSAGLDLAGWSAAAHAEIEPHARAVLRRRWPDVPLLGDVSAIDGRDFAGITLLSGGSPCQDLSIAGKRAGMTEGSGTRSALYFEQVRIWQESEAPYFLWENVLGALSSNTGRDFAAVLSALVGASLAVPDDGWGGAGVASGPAGVAAWRVLDCQYFGPPQRRRRVFVLGATAGGVDPAEVLALGEGVSGHPAPRREAGEGLAADAGGGADSAGLSGEDRGPVAATFDVRNVSRVEPGRPSQTVHAGGLEVLTYPTISHPLSGEGCDASEDGTGRGTPLVVAYANRGREGGAQLEESPVAPSLRTPGGGSSHAIVLRNREGKPGGGKGPLVSAERSLTLGTANDQVVFPTVTAKWAKGSGGPAGAETGNLVWWDGGQVADALTTTGDGQRMPDKGRLQAVLSGTPRRLMPVECEKLMGWEPQHTAEGVSEDGKPYLLSDSARYKLCGNGVASPVAAWIGFRLRWALEG